MADVNGYVLNGGAGGFLPSSTQAFIYNVDGYLTFSLNGMVPVLNFYKMKADSGPSWINNTGGEEGRPVGAIGLATIVEIWTAELE